MGRRGEISYVLAIDGKPLREGLTVADRDLKKFEGAVGRAVKSLEGTEKKAAYDMGVLVKATRDLGGVAQLSSPQVDRLTQQVERLAKAGAKVPAEFKQIEASIKRVNQAAAMDTAARNAVQGAAGNMAGNLGVAGGVMAAAGPAGLAAAAGIGAVAAAATAATSALVGATQQALAFEGVITSQAAATGLSVDALQRYDYIAGRTDATLEGVTTSIGYMQRALVESPEKFRAIGLEVEKLRALAPDQQFEAVARAISSIEDPADRTAARMELLGRSSSGIAKFIDEMDRFREAAAQMSLDQGAVDAVGKLGDALDGAGKNWERFWITLGGEIAQAPQIVEAVDDIADAILNLTQAVRDAGIEDWPIWDLLGAAGAVAGFAAKSPGKTAAAPATLGTSLLPGLADPLFEAASGLRAPGKDFGLTPISWLETNARIASLRDEQLAHDKAKAAADLIAAIREEAARTREAAEQRKRDTEALKAAAEEAKRYDPLKEFYLLRATIAGDERLRRADVTAGFEAAASRNVPGPVFEDPAAIAAAQAAADRRYLDAMPAINAAYAKAQATAVIVERTAKESFDFSQILQDAAGVWSLLGIEAESALGKVVTQALAGAAAFQQMSRVLRVSVLDKDGKAIGSRAAKWGDLTTSDRFGLGLSTVSSGVQAYQSGSVLGGALGMAGTGAALGSVVPGIGNAVGAVGGAVLGGILGLFGGGAQDRRRREEERNQATEKAASDLANLAQQIERLRMEKLQTGASGVAKVFEHLARAEGDVSDRMERMGRIGFAVFSALRAEGLSTVEAMKQLAPALDAALAAAEAQGTELDGSFGALAGFQALVGEHSELVETAEAYAGIFDALRSTGNLDEATFGDLQGELNAVFAELEDAGFSTNQALALIAPSLYQAAQAAEQLGIPLDENTQALVDQAEAAGLMEGMSDPMEDMVELLSAVVLIQAEMVRLWGGEIPDAIQKTIDKILAMPNPPIPGAGGAPSGGSADGEVPYTGHPSQDYQPDLPRAAVGGVFRAPRRGGLIETHDVEAVIPLNNAPTGPGLAAFADEIAKRLGGGDGDAVADAVRELASRPIQVTVMMPNGSVLAEATAQELERGSPGGRRLERAARLAGRQ